MQGSLWIRFKLYTISFDIETRDASKIEKTGCVEKGESRNHLILSRNALLLEYNIIGWEIFVRHFINFYL